jgi:hypothetical protein
MLLDAIIKLHEKIKKEPLNDQRRLRLEDQKARLEASLAASPAEAHA